jgi:hypothetical protein
MAGVVAFGGNQALIFVKPQCRRGHAASRRHLPDRQDIAHPVSVRQFSLDFKCT